MICAVGQRGILFVHALKNAAIPIVTVVGIGVAVLLRGTVVTETVFGIPGLGRLTSDAILQRDYPVIQGIVLIFSFIYVIVNLIVRYSSHYGPLPWERDEPRLRPEPDLRFVRCKRRRGKQPQWCISSGGCGRSAAIHVWLALDSSSANNNPQDVYAILRMMPPEADVWQYRVKRVGGEV